MRTDIITITNDTLSIEKALDKVEYFANFSEFTHNGALYLRVLCQEMLSTVSKLMDKDAAKMWINTDGGSFEINLKVRAIGGFDQRNKNIDILENRQSTMPKGFFARIVAAIDILTSSGGMFTDPLLAGMEFINKVSGMVLSLNDSVFSSKNKLENNAIPIEREKKYLNKLADNIVVTITNDCVNIIGSKKLESI